MTWLTFFHGLALFAIGIACRFVIQLQQWQALVPIVMGLGYLTLAEGIRSKPTQRRLFLFLAIIWSVVILVVSLPLAKDVLKVWQNQPVQLDGMHIRSELVIEHVIVLIFTAFYALVAARALFQRPKPKTPSSVN